MPHRNRTQHKHKATDVFYYEAPPRPPRPPTRVERLRHMPVIRKSTLARGILYSAVLGAALLLPQYLLYQSDPSFTIQKPVIRAGQTLVVRADKTSSRHSYYCALDGRQQGKFLPDAASPRLRALVPLPYETAPGKHLIEVKQTLTNKTVFSADIFANTGITETTHLKIGKKKRAKLLSKKTEIRKARKSFGQAFTAKLPEQLWRGTFILPAQGRFTAPPGQLRILPDNKKTFHRGQDIALPIGSTVTAANQGIVTLAGNAEDFPLQGNCVVIAHGQDVYSVYEHLDSTLVKEGAFVKKGQQIGTSGNTGYSTGPHLHWGMLIKGVMTDPIQWLSTEF